jgi:hypothetical protein
MDQLAQLPVKLLTLEPTASGVRAVGADSIHSVTAPSFSGLGRAGARK